MAFLRNKNLLKHLGHGHAVACARITLGGAGAPTVVEGSEWVASVTHTGGSNDLKVTLKDTIAAVIFAGAEMTGGTALGDWVSPTDTLANFLTNEASASPLVVLFKTLQAGGTARNDQTGTVFLMLYVRESNVLTPGGN